jgi:diadenylate cyclase
VKILSEYLKNIDFVKLINSLANSIGVKGSWDILRAIIDISIVSFLIYKIIHLVRETRAWQLLKGLLVVLFAAKSSEFLGLKTIAFILNYTVQYIAIALVVLFQPELRRGLEQIGRSKFGSLFNFEDTDSSLQTSTIIEEIVKSAERMSKSFTGALIVIERETKIGEAINSGTSLDANITSELLINVFTQNTPLHDGAVIIRGNRLKAAACFLPLTDNPDLSKDLGTRHRAALGITEISDSIVVVVSEETGKISVALNGGLTRNLNSDMLRKALNKNLLEKKATLKNKKLSLWKVKTK